MSITVHIEAEKNDFTPIVLMPGDPLRAQFIAEQYLQEVRLINKVRGMLAYSGTYKGKRVSVMGSGMGTPSIGIYSYELYKFFGVKGIIRVGSAGAVSKKVKVNDIVVGLGCCTNSNYAHQYKLPGTYAPIASFSLLEKCTSAAKAMGIKLQVGNILTSDVFYYDTSNVEEWGKMGVLAIEMEAAALYMNAARLGKDALAICTVSDSPYEENKLNAEERQLALTRMIELALECI